MQDKKSAPTLGRVLRNARLRAGVTQKQLSLRTGIAAPSLSRIENGHESPSFERLATCLEALGFEPTVELRPLAGSRADPVHLAAEVESTAAQRLERLFAWMRFGDRLVRARLSPLAPPQGTEDA